MCIRDRKKSLAVSVAYVAAYRLTSGFKGRTFKLCVLNIIFVPAALPWGRGGGGKSDFWDTEKNNNKKTHTHIRFPGYWMSEYYKDVGEAVVGVLG